MCALVYPDVKCVAYELSEAREYSEIGTLDFCAMFVNTRRLMVERKGALIGLNKQEYCCSKVISLTSLVPLLIILFLVVF